MFRTAELGQKISKEEFKRIEPELRLELHELQRKLRSHGKHQVIIVLAGVDGGGKGDTVKILNEWMDARWLINHAYRPPSDEERERPAYWRYWRNLPPRGQIGLYLSSWYSQPVIDYAYGKIGQAKMDRKLERILSFENTLADDGALILKFWIHLSKKGQKERFRKLEKNPLLSWQVTKKDWKHYKMYDNFISAAEKAITKTNTGQAPWHIVEGKDARFRHITVGRIIRDALKERLEESARAVPANTSTEPLSGESREEAAEAPRTIFSGLDMGLSLGKEEYKTELRKYQARLNQLNREARRREISTIVVFEGPDAAGKGGAIRRIIAALDPHNYQVLPFAAPTDEERAQHYLWRFWRRLSRAGDTTIFDRSWYGRVLVERIEGFASEEEWKRAYAEINDFEEQLTEHGCILVKYWVHITKDEQLERFRAREKIPHKSWKLTDEDWRNREKWEQYEKAAHDMIQYTSTRTAPWVVIEGNSKYYARVKAVRTLCEYMERALGGGKKSKRR